LIPSLLEEFSLDLNELENKTKIIKTFSLQTKNKTEYISVCVALPCSCGRPEEIEETMKIQTLNQQPKFHRLNFKKQQLYIQQMSVIATLQNDIRIICGQDSNIKSSNLLTKRKAFPIKR
jgi:hypothetical protein